MLFSPSEHEPLVEAPWRPAAAEAAIREIAADAEDALRAGAWWPMHPLDLEDDGDEDGPGVGLGIYLGAAGVLWALDRLAQEGRHAPRRDLEGLATEAFEACVELGERSPSLWLGETGIALVAWLLAPSPAVADRLAAIVATPPADDAGELLYGSPGLLVAAEAMLERTGEPRWARAWRTVAERVLAAQGERVPGLWTARIGGSEAEYLGPAHGAAGIVAALARRRDLLADDRPLAAAVAALSARAVREDGLANWPPAVAPPLHDPCGIRTQWCHGAPGIVASLAALEPDDALDALLLAGGELTWAAGPLRKGPGLCHGTAGNGFALLKLLARTGDEAWLARARRFAMHAAAQVAEARRRYGRGRHSLWTGDLGVALFLDACLTARADLPALEMW